MSSGQSDVHESQKQDDRSTADRRLSRMILALIVNGENEIPLCAVEARLTRCSACLSFRGDGCLDYPKGYAAALVGLEGPPCEKWVGI